MKRDRLVAMPHGRWSAICDDVVCLGQIAATSQRVWLAISHEYDRLTFKWDPVPGISCSLGQLPSERCKDEAVATETRNGVPWSGQLRILLMQYQYVLLSRIGCVESPACRVLK